MATKINEKTKAHKKNGYYFYVKLLSEGNEDEKNGFLCSVYTEKVYLCTCKRFINQID